MTDRPLGTPEPDATDPDVDALEAAEADAIEAAVPDDDEVALDDDDEPGDDDGDPGDDDELEDDEVEVEAEPDDYDAAVREVAGETVAPTAAAGATTIPTKRKPTPTPAHVPTVSERAVHVREDVSKVFVIGAVAVFAVILLNALLLGNGGLLDAKPTASPSASAAPSAGASASAPVSAVPSASPSVAASAAPSVSASPAASAAPSASPSP